MITRSLGENGPDVSALGLGTMSWPGCRFGETGDPRTDPAEAVRMVREALDLGITLFDTAEGYGRGLAEQHLAIALREAGCADGVTVVAKVGPLFGDEQVDGRACDLSRDHLRERVHGSLARLGVERLDVLLAHWPDPLTPIEETMAAIHELREEGKLAYFGVSNFSAELLAQACALGSVVCNQLPCSLADRSIEDGRRAACLALGVGVMAYSPIGKGVLTGKYDESHRPPSDDYRNQRAHFRENFERNVGIAGRLKEIAADFSVPPVAVALAWTLRLPGIAVAIPGAKSPEQIRDHVRVVELLENPAALERLAEFDGIGSANG